jgi:HSP20 family molecular chaperone IbpA
MNAGNGDGRLITGHSGPITLCPAGFIQRGDMQDEKNNWRERPQLERHWLEYNVWRQSRQFVPPTDIIEFADKILVLVEIAALRPTDLGITLLEDRLVIAGTRERPPLSNAAYHQVEIGYGEFRVDVLLHWSVRRDAVTATYRDGLLEVELPRQPESQITVKGGTSSDDTSGDDTSKDVE